MITRQQRAALSRAAIISAARELFDGVGYEAATVRALAHRLNASTGLVFAHFSGKARLYREVYGHAPISPEAGAELLRATTALMESCGFRAAGAGDGDGDGDTYTLTAPSGAALVIAKTAIANATGISQ